MSKKIKDSRIKNQKEKAIKAIVSVYDEPSYYQQWQDELDAPRWYLEKTYPIFYKHFEKKFNKFIKDWDSMTGDKNIHPNLIKDLFIFYCRMITAEIKAESNIKDSIEYIEKNGFPKVKHNRVSLTTESFDQAINILFEVPELILASFDKEKNKWTEKQKKFIGNPIENRKGDRVNKYKRVITYVKCIKQRFEKLVEPKHLLVILKMWFINHSTNGRIEIPLSIGKYMII